MCEDKGKRITPLAVITRACMTCALAASLVGLAGCSQASPEPAAPAGTQDTTAATEAEDDAHDLPVEAPEGEGATEDEEGVSFDNWAPECLDANGDVTVYALSELKGWQLETMMQQQEYTWSARNQLWVNKDDSVALVVLDSKGEELSDEGIAELDRGSFEAAAGYRIVTSRYNSVEKAFDGLVGKVMVCEDSAFEESSGVAVVYGPSMHRSLVFLSTSDDVICLTMYGEEAVAAGLFNTEAGSELGKTIDETFETLVGRPVGSASE